MIDYRNKAKKPFKVGELVRWRNLGKSSALSLVLELEWNSFESLWLVVVLSQRTGNKIFRTADCFVPIEENND